MTKTWQDALDYVKCLNTNNILGCNYWRLPNLNELESLLNAKQSNSANWLMAQGYVNVQAPDLASGYYWSSNSLAYSADQAWAICLLDGDVYEYDKTVRYYVWPVRTGQSGPTYTAVISLPATGQTKCYSSSGSEIVCTSTGQDGELQKGTAWPNPRFTDNGDGTMTDNLTTIIWTKDGKTPGPQVCSTGTAKTWQQALDQVKCLNTNNYLEHNDWRLPNIKELRSLAHYGQPDIFGWLNSNGFVNIQPDNYWSSTNYAYNANHAWIVDMWVGSANSFLKSAIAYVWPARGGLYGLLNNKGDINKDGLVDLSDAISAFQVMAAISTLEKSIYLSADVNNDVKIGLPEAIYILQVMAGIRN